MSAGRPSTWINRAGFHEAQRVVPRVLSVERALAPRTHADLLARLAVNVFLRETTQRLRPGEQRVEILHCEVERVRSRMRRPDRRHVDNLERDGAAGEVDARPGLFPALDIKELAIEVC